MGCAEESSTNVPVSIVGFDCVDWVGRTEIFYCRVTQIHAFGVHAAGWVIRADLGMKGTHMAHRGVRLMVRMISGKVRDVRVLEACIDGHRRYSGSWVVYCARFVRVDALCCHLDFFDGVRRFCN